MWQKSQPFSLGQAHAEAPGLPEVSGDLFGDGAIRAALRVRWQFQKRFGTKVPAL
jgi:hypothetical protein